MGTSSRARATPGVKCRPGWRRLPRRRSNACAPYPYRARRGGDRREVFQGAGESHFSTSSLTLALPDFTNPRSSAARRVTSITAGFEGAIRSLIVTTTLFPLSRFVTFTLDPYGNFLWDAVSLSLS